MCFRRIIHIFASYKVLSCEPHDDVCYMRCVSTYKLTTHNLRIPYTVSCKGIGSQVGNATHVFDGVQILRTTNNNIVCDFHGFMLIALPIRQMLG